MEKKAMCDTSTAAMFPSLAAASRISNWDCAEQVKKSSATASGIAVAAATVWYHRSKVTTFDQDDCCSNRCEQSGATAAWCFSNQGRSFEEIQRNPCYQKAEPMGRVHATIGWFEFGIGQDTFKTCKEYKQIKSSASSDFEISDMVLFLHYLVLIKLFNSVSKW